MSWSLHVAHRRRDDSLVDVAGLARTLPPGPERDVARELAVQARLDGLATAGQLIDRLEHADGAQRRRLLDRAREAAGLEPLAELEQQERIAALRARPEPFTSCAIPGCRNLPTVGPGNPTLRDPHVRRWHCGEHEHLAQPGDMQPWRWRHAPSGGIELVDDPGEYRDAAVRESQARQAEQDAGRRQADHEAAQAEERARIEAMDRELPASLRGAA